MEQDNSDDDDDGWSLFSVAFGRLYCADANHRLAFLSSTTKTMAMTMTIGELACLSTNGICPVKFCLNPFVGEPGEIGIFSLARSLARSLATLARLAT